MEQMQQDVLAFHREVCEFPDQTEPNMRDQKVRELRAKLILEEAKETAEAILGRKVEVAINYDEPGDFGDEPDIVETIDGLCDTVYVCLGAALEFGVDLEPFWKEVQRSNMAKAGGPVREDGKRMKPEGWTPPDIENFLELMKITADPSVVCSTDIPVVNA